MNEYTRRDEVLRLLVSTVIMVVAVGGSLALLTTAKGKMAPNAEAVARAEVADVDATTLDGCLEVATTLVREVKVFRDVASTTNVLAPTEEEEAAAPAPSASAPNASTAKPGASARPPGPKFSPENSPSKTDPKKPKLKPKGTDLSAQAWPAVKPTHDRAVKLRASGCRAVVEKAYPEFKPAEIQAWSVVEAIANVKGPLPGDTSPNFRVQLEAARTIAAELEKGSLETLPSQIENATLVFQTRASEERARAESEKAELPLPRGLLGRDVAVAAGLGISLMVLLVSLISLRATSRRRALALAPYRKAAHPPERGLHAATILRLAASPNGGEPGMVVGAALGGFIASLAARTDADWYAAGVMAGLLIGLLVQLATRNMSRSAQFRRRALALSELEKPAVPIVLALSTIRPGMEGEFLGFFLKLSPSQAGQAVEKLATQAEEQILMAAEAQSGS